jgi:mannose-6-phosphate isomerase-like protein (cupin superfamily)
MALFIKKPTVIEAAGNKPKLIEEFFGRVNSNTSEVSIARMNSPQGWVEPGQCPDFNEYTIVLKGTLSVKTKDSIFEIKAGQGILIPGKEWVQYSSPLEGGAEYIAVCLPAFSPDTVNRDE